jgi:hypothetical protein
MRNYWIDNAKFYLVSMVVVVLVIPSFFACFINAKLRLSG